ncbi:MAG: RsbRD N-terminal domain-containing protein [Proteobacteria bacterium]|nr:RsbRD N-terminal domain-containing protein [Pseudomonadota bacterium]
MDIPELLKENRSAILKEWKERTLATYPIDATQFLKKQKDPFANPVGHKLSLGLEEAFDGLFHDKHEVKLDFLADFMRVRAVQDFTPSRAVAFLFELKGIVREKLRKELAKLKDQDLYELDSRVDRLALTGFDLYAESKAKLAEIRLAEVKNAVYNALAKANLVCELPEASGSGQEAENRASEETET